VEIVIFESGVAEAPAERKEWLGGVVEILALGGWLLVVVVGNLADGARDSDGELAAGIVIAEENFRGGGAAFLAEIPAVENRRCILGDEVDRVGTPRRARTRRRNPRVSRTRARQVF